MAVDGQGINAVKNIGENFNRLSTVHERYTDRQAKSEFTANVNVSSPPVR